MRLTHPDYTRLLIKAYKEKRANNELPLLLTQSSPAKIRQACVHMYNEYLDKKEHQILRKDEQVLRDFFGPAEPGKQFLQLIGAFNTDRFRPLDNYLKENTEKTDNTNLELLAWLINFQHRPYIYDKNFQLSDEELDFIKNNDGKQPESVIGKIDLQKDEEAREAFGEMETEKVSVPIEMELEPPLITNSKNDKAKKRSKRAIMIILIFIICTGAIYVIWQQKKIANNVCVYWANDHYEQVSCNENPKGRIIIPMDPGKVKSFRRITREDTITARSVGRLYYIKDSNTFKYYTEPGNYPEDLNRTLKVLSQYVFEKHLRKKEILGTDPLVEQDNKGFK